MDRKEDTYVFNANQLKEADLARQYYNDIIINQHQAQHSNINNDQTTKSHWFDISEDETQQYNFNQNHSPVTNLKSHANAQSPHVQTRQNEKYKKQIEKLLKKIKTIFTIYITLAGLVTFSLFIIEESLQTVMFSTWAAKDSKEWPLILNANRFFKKTNATLDFINTYFGWINPFSLYAYDSYSKATNHFVLANEANLAAFATELLVEEQEEITLYLNVRSVIHHETNNVQWTELDCYKFTVYCNSTFNATPGNVITFNGFITKNKNQSGQYVASPFSISVFTKQNSRD